MRRRAPRGAAAAVVALWLAAAGACAPDAPAWDDIERRIADHYPDVPQLTTAELAALRSGGRPVVLLDARDSAEYAVSHLAGAHHAPTVEAAAGVIRRAPPGALVVAYCSVGLRSSALADALRARGIEGVHNLRGSLFAWANEGRPVHRGAARVDAVHPFDARWGRLLDAELHALQP